jgi:hypothetical protein
MPKPRRRPPHQWSDLSRLVVPVGAGLTLLVCVWGFVHFTAIALYKQRHFAEGAEHPDDGYAAFLLFLGMIALAALLLGLREPPPMRWRKPARTSGERQARPGRKPRRRSGTIERQ